MTFSDKVQIPIGQLQIAGRSLETVSSDLNDADKLITILLDVDAVHGHRMANAVHAFFIHWKQARHVLFLNIGGLGEISSEIANNTSQFDGQTASVLGEFADSLMNLSSQLASNGIGDGHSAKASHLSGLCRPGSADDVYAFQNSTSEEAKAGIRGVMGEIRGTFKAILQCIEELEPQWEATEADAYFEVVRNLHSAGDQIAEILDAVEQSLGSVREGSDELRKGILEALENCE